MELLSACASVGLVSAVLLGLSMVVCQGFPWSTVGLGFSCSFLIVVLYYFILFYIFTCIYLYCFLASILRFSSACLLDTAAGLLSVAYAPFGTVSSWYCLYCTVIGSALG